MFVLASNGPFRLKGGVGRLEFFALISFLH